MTQKDRKGKGKKAPKESDDSAGDYDALYSSTTDEGEESVKAEDLLECAEERLLHSAPPTSSQAPTMRRNGRAVAWVVFCGRKTGVFLTWAATQHQVTGHQGGLQKGYQTIEAANDAWAHGLATQTAYKSGKLGPTPTRKQRTRMQPSKAAASVEEIASRAAGLCLSGDEPLPSTNFKRCPVPSISTPVPSYPAVYAKKTKLTQTMAGPLVQSRASPSMQTISDPWWVVVQGSYPGVYHARYQAQAALDAEEPRAIERAGSLVIANQVFVTEYMQGHVIQNYF